MMVFFPSSQMTKVDVTNGTRASLSQPTHESAVRARKLLGWAPYGPDLTAVFEGDLSHGNHAANEELK